VGVSRTISPAEAKLLSVAEIEFGCGFPPCCVRMEGSDAAAVFNNTAQFLRTIYFLES